MNIPLDPLEAVLPDMTKIVISQLPGTVEAAQEFFAVERRTYEAAYIGMLCLDGSNERDITLADLAGIFDPADRDSAKNLANMASEGYDPTLPGTRLFLRAHIVGSAACVGILSMRFGDKVISLEEPGRKSIAKLHEIDVLPTYAGRGIGTALLRTGVDIAAASYDSSGTICLQVASENVRARSWYDNLQILRTGATKMITWPSGVQLKLEERFARIADLQARLQEASL